MRTPKQIFDKELSGKPLTEEAIIEVLKMYWNEAITETMKKMLKTDIYRQPIGEVFLKLKIK
jgi:hypothetical protein